MKESKFKLSEETYRDRDVYGEKEDDGREEQ